MVLVDLVLVEINMVKFEDIKVGAVVKKHNYIETYTITDINSKMILDNKSYSCICYVSNGANNYTRFARDINSFITTFDLVRR